MPDIPIARKLYVGQSTQFTIIVVRKKQMISNFYTCQMATTIIYPHLRRFLCQQQYIKWSVFKNIGSSALEW